MMSDIRTIILIYLIKICFSCLFSTSVAEVVQIKNTVKVANKSSRTESKVTGGLHFFVLSLEKKKIELPESVWEKDTEMDLEYETQ